MSNQNPYEKASAAPKRSPGRPSSRIDANILRNFRKELSLTQLELARRVYDKAGRADVDSRVLSASASRWESNGTVQIGLIEALAEVLGVTVAVLQGAAPLPVAARVEELEHLIRQRVLEGSSPELASELAAYRDEGSAEKALARSLNRRLEEVHLTRDAAELRALASLTGYTDAQLLKPTSHNGFWLLVASGLWDAPRHELVQGVDRLSYLVSKELEEMGKAEISSDCRIELRTEGDWFVITWSHPYITQKTRTLRFIRCQPDERGLRWASATEHDRRWLADLPDMSARAFNIVTGFDGKQTPKDLRALRLVLASPSALCAWEEQGKKGDVPILKVFEGALHEREPEFLENFVKEGSAHHVVLNWLTANLAEDLRPYLADWPRECWSAHDWLGKVDLHLDVPVRHWKSRDQVPPIGRRLSLMLAELTESGGLSAVPMSDRSAAYVVKRVNEMLKELETMQSTDA